METTLTITLAKKLRYLRKSNEIKQIDIGPKIGLSQQDYSDLENGKKVFTDEVIEKIASYFNITPADFELPLESVNVSNNHNNSVNANNNHIEIIQALVKSKDETIASHQGAINIQKELILQLKTNIEMLRNK